ncbi:DUF2642 domain-containing protein [Paenibacillus amylolyticus]|uniref:DUF2642 domain-containing protein n=1 Tax=Paenibacillus amylolyticus TaxID=1451 RepID=A0A5M9WNL6_PAEAM|nr:DUF2642 domain-containing protein [Paenibacillus amylolyticus]KAA8783129.1 DUF2642 domain-containing protein [Paenibacillus amylolyticus]
MKSAMMWLGKTIEFELSGCKLPIQGEVIDAGEDIIVVYGNQRYIYVPLHHIQTMHFTKSEETSTNMDVPAPDPEMDHDNISYRKVLMNARGRFSEISIGGRTLHGYITSIMNDYFIFYSPLHHSVYVSIHHLKYIIPSPSNSRPFAMEHQHFPIQPSSISLSRTLDQQLQKMAGELVILNLGYKPEQTGLLKSINDKLLEVIDADGSTRFMHTSHVQTLHLP